MTLELSVDFGHFIRDDRSMSSSETLTVDSNSDGALSELDTWYNLWLGGG